MTVFRAGILSIFFMTSFCFAKAPSCNAINDNDIEIFAPAHSHKSNFVGKYINSLVVGTAAGAAIGALNGYFDHIAPGLWPITWLFAAIERESLIGGISQDMDEHGIAHREALMHLSSYIASWIAYYKTYHALQGHPPF